MTIFMDFRPISPPCLLFFLLSFCFLSTITAGNNDTEKLVPPNTINGGADGGDNIGDISTTNPLLLPPPPPPPPPDSLPNGRTNNFAPFRPSIAVIVGVLTTMFSITFLLLLYAKHCKRGHAVAGLVYGGGGNVNSRNGLQSSAAARKNSGIDRNVIESLPIFRFGSLRGQKDGLECAVCLTRFETTEVLRLLPKCKHAFHVECVDTWLDAHSTCPLCRYRVDAEDILLVEDAMILRENEPLPPPQPPSPPPPPQQEQEADVSDIESRRSGTELNPGYRRVSGRHSSAGERGSNGFLQIVLQRPGEPADNSRENPTLMTTTTTTTPSSRRSLDSSSLKRKTSNNESVNLGCFEHRTRKDGLLLLSSDQNRKSFEQRRFSHRIIVSADHRHHQQQQQQRWSDVQPSDLLYLRSEMILTLSDDSRRYSSSASGSRPSSSSRTRQQRHHQKVQVQEGEESSGSAEVGIDDGRNVINTRCVSEITGLSRFPSNHNYNNNRHLQQSQLQERQRQQRQEEEGVVSRWLAWISQSRPAVRSQGGQV